MENELQLLSHLVEIGKIDKNSPYPAEFAGMDGASELTLQILKNHVAPQIILSEGLIPGMKLIGEKFSIGEAFIPDLLIAAKAMNASLEHLKPFMLSGEIKSKGTLVIGTVKGDLHDIGKNLVKIIMQGDGWKVIDLGTDVSTEKYVNAVNENDGAIVGMSALLTTTMLYMESVVKELRKTNMGPKIFIGGAPVSQSFCDLIGADGYFSDPYCFARSFSANN